MIFRHRFAARLVVSQGLGILAADVEEHRRHARVDELSRGERGGRANINSSSGLGGHQSRFSIRGAHRPALLRARVRARDALTVLYSVPLSGRNRHHG
jgi:hypothetical protein